MNAAVAEHEARHAAAGLLLGVPVLEASANPDEFAAGYVIPGLDGLDRDLARRFALLLLAGRIGDPGWPPASPPSTKAATRDERQLAALAPLLEGSWHGLCAEALRLSSEPEFVRLEDALAGLLEQGHVLDERTLRHVHAIATQGAKMQHKTVEASSRVTDLGEFSAIAAAYTVDRQGEQVKRGAFKQTIARWQASGRVLPLHWNHSGAAADIIGLIDPASMRETSEGLFVRGRLDLEDSEVAREAWRSMKANRVALSFGYLEVDGHKRSDGVRELRELDLFEVSIVPAPANPDTRFLALKSIDGDGVPSHTEVERRLIEEGIIAPIVDPEVFERERDLMLDLLATRRNGDEREGKALTDAELRAKSAALGVDPRPIRVERFEVD